MVEISVIMPVFNAENYLEEAINSILNQTFSDLELICVDDGSKDNSLNMLYEFEKKDDRIQVYHQENNGGGAARNLALPKAKGKYLYFMDADDIIELNAFQEFYDLIEEKKVDFILCKAINYDSDEEKYYETEYFSMNELYECVGDEVFSYKDIGNMVFKISVTPWGKFFNREFVINSGAQFAEGLIFHDNIFFWEMLFHSERIFFYNKILCYRRVHSKSSVKSKDLRFLDNLKITNKIVEIFIKYDKFDEFERELYHKRIESANSRYNQIDIKYKQNFLDAMKKDFSKMLTHEKYNDFISLLSPFDKAFYESAIEADTYKEFNALMDNYHLIQEINSLKNNKSKLNKQKNKLKKDIDKLKKQKAKLQDNNKKLKEKNSDLRSKNKDLKEELKIMKSTVSWKVTKPLRTVKKELSHKSDD